LNPFQVKKAIKVFETFENNLSEYWDIQKLAQDSYSRGRKTSRQEEENKLQSLRQQLSWLLGKALYYEKLLNISTHLIMFPPANIGSPSIKNSAFNWSLIYANSHPSLVPRKEAILDAIRVAITNARILHKKSWIEVLNPVNWIVLILSWIVRIPFLILRQAGVSSKVEENIISQAIKVLSMIGLIYVFLKIPFFKDNGAIDVLISLIK